MIFPLSLTLGIACGLKTGSRTTKASEIRDLAFPITCLVQKREEEWPFSQKMCVCAKPCRLGFIDPC